MGLFLPHGRRGGRDGAALAISGWPLDDRIYFSIALVIAVAILGDLVLNSADASVFLVRKMLDLVQALSFWRH